MFLTLFPLLASVLFLSSAWLMSTRQLIPGDARNGFIVGLVLIALVAAIMFGVTEFFATVITC